MLQASQRVSAATLWANLHLLFWLSLVPFVTGWMGENHFAALPVALYGVVLLGAGVAYKILQSTLIAHHGAGSTLARAIGGDTKGLASIAMYVAAIALAFAYRWAACAIYVAVALLWLIPDRRIARSMADRPAERPTGAADAE